MNNNKNEKNNSPISEKNSKEFSVGEIRYQSSLFWSSALLWAIIGSVGFGVIFSFIARIDEVVNVRGELQAKGAERPIKAPFNSIIQSIKVKEGERVKKGQTLIELDTREIEAQIEGLKANLISLKNRRKIKKEIVEKLYQIKEKGAISLIYYLEKKGLLEEIESEISVIKSKIKELEVKLIKAKLSSPINGTVFNLIPSNIDYFVTGGETILLIIPEGDLEAKIFLTNKDIGYVKPNMNAEIRVDAFPYTQFGSIKGVLHSVGAEALPVDQQNSQPRFPALVKLDEQDIELNGNKYELKSGQSISVNLIVRDKPVITLLTNSIEKAIDSLRGIKSDRK
ncbi:HlyD family efflux transporter periplasmic adaptor subunit [Prochlorococcus marinus XMU1406]|uniref:HlyD family efflux transporter periplasmic adaptor subunit n=1 Tax=Prochlorococcus marinus TaxID=1219 RepID=UPI001ADCF6E0|nr:HlyD family efflux transporter periplasmic adaptor subunit [Prochlorococcus marinus XMU1406]MCR8544274.1 HlyD family efflux transporter periplasmic adaptor subunit [Prochlorococcus marinus XMU1427]